MTSEFSDDPDVELHREADRHDWEDFWESPSFEKWRKGGKWKST